MLNVDQQVKCESFVGYGRDLREACKEYIDLWESFEARGTPLALLTLKESCNKIDHNIMGMLTTFNKYVDQFLFTPSPLRIDYQNSIPGTMPCVSPHKEEY